MAVDQQLRSTSATGRRWLFGTNVTILVLLLLFIVVGVNLVAGLKGTRARADLAGGFSAYRLSERARKIIDRAGDDVVITTVYTSDDPESDRETYLPKLRDLTEEIRQENRKIRVQHLYSGDQRAELRDRVQSKFGTAAEDYGEAVRLAESVWDQVTQSLAPLQADINTVIRGQGTWLGDFTTLATYATRLRTDLENIGETRREVEDLVHGEGLPRYEEANRKIKEANDKLKTDLEGLRDWLKNMQELANLLSNKDSEFATTTRKQLEEGRKLVDDLVAQVGDPADQTVPEDPVPVIREFAKSANALSSWLMDEVARVDAFADAHPAIEQHPGWLLSVQQGPLMFKMPLSMILSQTADSLSQNAQQARMLLTRQVPKDQLQHSVRTIRQIAADVQANMQDWEKGIRSVLEGSGQVDPQSRSLFARAAGKDDEHVFVEVLDRLKDVNDRIEGLPELELDDTAERLQEDNIVVIEMGSKVRVLKFDDVWPLADPMAGRMGGEEESRRRVFDGDSAISSALLSMMREKPFATIVFVAYETQPAPQMRQMGARPNEGRIPLSQLTTLKKKLEQANFAVKDWNLGAEGDEANRPELEEATRAVYVFLPPAPPPQQNPMQPQPDQKSFGEAELTKVRAVLNEEGAQAIFLTAWDPPQMSFFGPMPTEYAYDQLLQERYGIDVRSDYRLIRGVPDEREPGAYAIDIAEISHMQLSTFTDHPIGKPLQSRRMLMADVCPVQSVEESGAADRKVPQDVTLTPILRVPTSVKDLWAESNEGIRRISNILREGERRGLFTKDPGTSLEPPFTVILLATQKSESPATEPAATKPADAGANQEQKLENRALVMGTGGSLADYFLMRRVPRFEGEGKRARFLTDPPPMENAELFVNSVYYLSGQPEMIAAGPAEVPLVPPLEPGTKRNVFVITAVWAFAVLALGGVVMLVRRK
jgi:hypothetical protein